MLFQKKNQKLSKSISLRIPRGYGFQEMTVDEKKEFYPIQGEIPEQAFINNEDTVIISVKQVVNSYFHTDDLEDYQKNVFEPMMGKTNSTDCESSIIEVKKIPFLVVSQIIPLDKPIFMKTLIGSHKHRMVLVSFTCPAKEKDNWLSVIDKMFQSVRVKSLKAS